MNDFEKSPYNPTKSRSTVLALLKLSIFILYFCTIMKVQPLPNDAVDPKTTKSLGKKFTNSDLAKLVEYLEFFKRKQLDNDTLEQNREDWNKLARVLDRLCLLIFILFFMVDFSVILGIKFTSAH